ncbi:unnamed protein product [Closterium sp. NIES-64]|nr:unnamed protein product [Closterium sp. NIES-64]
MASGSAPSTSTNNNPASVHDSTTVNTDPVEARLSHPILKHFLIPFHTKGNPKLCKFCGKKFEGGTNRCAIHLATWKGQEKRAVALCKDAPTAVRDEFRGMYETKAEQQDLKRGAAATAIHSALDARDGVTVSSDMMTDRCGPQANVLLVNDSGAVFEQAVDCNMESKTGGYIASLLRPVIDKVGPKNVVAVCTDGGSNYASVAKKIASTWPHIEHVPCATHVLDLMMEDMGKMGWAKGLVEKEGR